MGGCISHPKGKYERLEKRSKMSRYEYQEQDNKNNNINIHQKLEDEFKKYYDQQTQLRDTNVRYQDILKAIPFLSQQYQIQKIIGFGAFGMVFLCEDMNNHQLYAIKLIPCKNIVNLADQLKEASIMRIVRSPYVAKVYESFSDPENDLNFYIVSEHYPGGDLENFLENNKNLEERQIVKLFYEILLGMKALHDKKVIHSDLKPENIFLTSNFQPVIADFGMANVIKENKSNASKKGFNYRFSPLEVFNQDRISFGTDYFSLGMILMVLCGQAKDIDQITQMKTGKFPDFQKNSLKNLLELAKEMMANEISQRMNIKQAISYLKDKYSEISFPKEIIKNQV